MKTLLLLFLLFTGRPADEKEPAQSAAGKKLDAEEIISAVLKTTDGNVFRMYETRKYTASVFVFLLPDCPACESYSLPLNNLSLKYQTSGIQFYGVFPPFVKKEEIEGYRKKYKINFPLLIDYNKELIHALDAKVAPSAYVLSESTVLLYRGRIDDWMYAVGRKRTVITHHELTDALHAITRHEKIAVQTTVPVGCLID